MKKWELCEVVYLQIGTRASNKEEMDRNIRFYQDEGYEVEENKFMKRCFAWKITINDNGRSEKSYSTRNFMDIAKQLGEQGWEFVHCLERDYESGKRDYGSHTIHYYFKRPIFE